MAALEEGRANPDEKSNMARSLRIHNLNDAPGRHSERSEARILPPMLFGENPSYFFPLFSNPVARAAAMGLAPAFPPTVIPSVARNPS